MVAIDIKDVLARAKKQKLQSGTAKQDVSEAVALLEQKAADQCRTSFQTLAADQIQVCMSLHVMLQGIY